MHCGKGIPGWLLCKHKTDWRECKALYFCEFAEGVM